MSKQQGNWLVILVVLSFLTAVFTQEREEYNFQPSEGQLDYTEMPTFPESTETRVDNSQDKYDIKWFGTPNSDFYVTYGYIRESNGASFDTSASWEGNQLPISISFYLDSRYTTTATINLLVDGEVKAEIYRNEQLCDQSVQIGSQPSLRVTCFPE
jgi:hypothetical protein